MEKSNKKKITQVDSPSASQNDASGLIYWEDYDFDNQTDTSGYIKEDFNIIYDAPSKSN